jgi:Family of unknown function (DUF6338)
MDFAVAQLALLFLPGIIWANIDTKYGAGLKPTQTMLLVRAFTFGVATYAALYLIYFLCGVEFGYDKLARGNLEIDFFQLQDEILFSVPLSFIMAVLWLWIVRFRLLKRFLHLINATRRFGDENVWSFALNSDDATVEYVHVRDNDNGFVFAGWVNAYSENEDFRELLLSDVIVYDDTGNELYRVPVLYLARPLQNIWVEFPFSKEGYSDVGKENRGK